MKRVFVILVFFVMTIQFNITSCSSATDSSGSDSTFTASVNNPTNDYQVVGEVISVGGLGGCSIGTVSQMGLPVEDADFKINNATLFYDLLYADTLFQLAYAPGLNYSLNVSHDGQTIATGSARMPSTPVISNLNSIQNHTLNTAMQVNWRPVQYANSIQVTIIADIFDEQIQEYIERGYQSALIPADETTFTIPDTFFTYEGEYTLGIVAYHGVNPDFDISILEIEGYSKSYNMNGAVGAFLAVSLSSEDGALITVGSPLPKANTGEKTSFKDYVIDKHKKYFGGQIFNR